MGVPWSHALPIVKVEKSRVPKRITLIVPYYCNPDFFEFQVKHWRSFPVELREMLSVIVVDDGSPVTPATDVLRSLGHPKHIKLFRIHEDRRWNWLAARNIGAHEAQDGWLMLTDMDHVLPVETLEALIYGVHRSDTIYGFSRREHTGEAINPHPNSWLLTKRLYWKWGGYDEALSGFYGTDGECRRRMAQTAKMAILSDHLTRYEHVGDSSTTRYLRKQPEDARVKQLIAARGRDWRPKTLSFSYGEIAS